MLYFILYILSKGWLALTILSLGLFLAYRRKSWSLAFLVTLLFLLISSICLYPQFSLWIAFPFLFLAFYLLVKRYRWLLYPALALGLLLLAVSPILGYIFRVYVPVNYYAYLEEKGQTVVVREDYYGSFFSKSDIEIMTYVNGQLPYANKIVYEKVDLHDFNKDKDVDKDVFLAQPLTRERLEELENFMNRK
ncbi:hypothetical protein K1I86_04240 [Streptococcus cristatus]|uniref:hypothetical protein n=1 Tax=Streptococcus cristatus TaxID=45634 RepID=UPI0011E84EF6|nr:hypothetical protein [Streptococcus cristatus]MBZ2151910.1 hypothetical protein [Streptococcus cristatus]